MAKRKKGGGGGAGAARASDAGALTVCHGCCCARTPDGRRDPEAVARLAALRREVTVTVADCLGPCDEKDVMVVRPSAAGRRAGGRPVWLAWTGDDDTTAAVLDWVRAGGPGLVDVPAPLEGNVFTPARRYRDDERAC